MSSGGALSSATETETELGMVWSGGFLPAKCKVSLGLPRHRVMWQNKADKHSKGVRELSPTFCDLILTLPGTAVGVVRADWAEDLNPLWTGLLKFWCRTEPMEGFKSAWGTARCVRAHFSLGPQIKEALGRPGCEGSFPSQLVGVIPSLELPQRSESGSSAA